jgi:hypothetical protein
MATIAASINESPGPKLVASLWHTALVVGLFLALALSGAFFQRQARSEPGMLQQHPRVVPLYLSLIVMEWSLVFWVWKSLKSTGTKLTELVGGGRTSVKNLVSDAVLALGLWGGWTLVQMAWSRRLGSGHAASIQTLLPRRGLEILLWIAVSISAGICEELVFRGYLQRQFEAFTHSRWIALMLQGALFGISHGYQGVEACMKIAVFGALFGLVAIYRGSLRPGMMAHAWGDILSGIFGI